MHAHTLNLKNPLQDMNVNGCLENTEPGKVWIEIIKKDIKKKGH